MRRRSMNRAVFKKLLQRKTLLWTAGDVYKRQYRIRDGHRHQTLAAYRKIYERDQSVPLSRTVTEDVYKRQPI